MRQSNIEGYLLVTPLQPRRCQGCAFVDSGGCEIRNQERRCSPAYADDATDSIYIADTDEARAVYTRARLGFAAP
jgi:hypothetical protein